MDSAMCSTLETVTVRTRRPEWESSQMNNSVMLGSEFIDKVADGEKAGFEPGH